MTSQELIHESDDTKMREGLTFDNPYELDLDSPAALAATRQLVDSRVPFIDATSRPDMAGHGRDLAVYMFDGRDEFASLAMAVEGEIIAKTWQRTPDMTRQEMAPYAHNSTFFLIVDRAAQPKVAGVLRIADCLTGPSETIDYYQQDLPAGSELPAPLIISDTDRQQGLWDIVGVFVRDGYLDGRTSVWAYHALYEASLEQGVRRWITNVTDKEFGNLNSMGIPFIRMADSEDKYMDRGAGKDPLKFTFCACDVKAIELSMLQKIDTLERDAIDIDDPDCKNFLRFAATLARIALLGAETVYSR